MRPSVLVTSLSSFFALYICSVNSFGQYGNAAELYVEQAIAWYGVTLKESPFEIGRGGTLRLKTRSPNPIERHEEAIFERAKKTGIAGHWIVISTDKNGDFSNAQIGQESGDIISIQRKELLVQVT